MESSGGGGSSRLIDAVLDSLASPIRLRMLRALARREMGYSELMEASGMRRERDAGKFTYHLKKLISAGLIEVDKRSRRYRITRRGSMALEHVGRLERELGASSMMIVRRSEHLMEPFDRGKIAAALVREAKLTPELASEIAALAEEKLNTLRIRYLTAPLIRELVNTILLDRGLEKYRHRLTRVGMPVHDVSRLLRRVAGSRDYRVFLEEAAGAVAEEYLLLNMLPRAVAEAHISGQLDLYPMSGWLTGVFGRAYGLREGGEALKLIGDLLWVRRELRVEWGGSGLGEWVPSILEGLPAGRTLSIGVGDPDGFFALASKVPQALRRKLKPIFNLDEASAEELLRLDERARKMGLNPLYTLGGRLLSPGYLMADEGLADLHGIGSINAPGAVLEAGRGFEEALEKVREAAARAAGALSRALKLFKELYEGRVGQASSAVAVCGLFEAAKLLTGSSPVISSEAREVLKEILKAAWQGVRRGAHAGEVRLAARCPRAAAARMAKADSYRFGVEEVEKVTGGEGGYSYTAVPAWERFRSLEDRLRLEAELAPLMNGGHVIVLGRVKRSKALTLLSDMRGELRSANPNTLIRFE